MLVLLFSFFLSNLKAQEFSCKATYDQMNITHQEVRSLEEFYYCFGYHHGTDRAWEMDFFRRLGQGRNAEVLGFSHLKGDLMMRLLNFPELAQKLWKEFSPEKQKWLIMYAQGVNEGFKIGKNAQEFKDENYSPETWLPEHSLLVLLLQSFDQTRKTFFRDYDEEVNKEKWEERTLSLFEEDGLPWESTILKNGEYAKKETAKTSTVFQKIPKLWGEFPSLFGEESGSNNWVISSKKSKTNHAILANDPHLDLKTPMFWYWIHLKAPEVNVIGASVPGVPVIASGTNGKVSWGLTNSYMKSAALYFLKDLKDEDIESFRPTVYIKWWIFQIPFFFKSFERLKTGHRILPLETESDHRIALKWTGFSLTAEEIYPMLDLMNADNVKTTSVLMKKIGVPSWNFVFADTDGNIGYQMVGKTYRYVEKTPYGIPVKTVKELEQEEFLPEDDRPALVNPARQFVATANNRHWPEDSQYYGGRGYSYSFRALRIDRLLDGKHDSESFKRIQCDQMVQDAEFFIPKLLKNIDIPEFKTWDMVAHDDSKVLPLYRRLMDLLFEKWEVNEYALYRLLDNLTVVQKEDLAKIYQIAKADVKERTWGKIHRVNYPHMSKNTDWIFSPDLPGPGDNHTVNPGTAKWNSDKKIYEHYSGASMRMIIEMSKPVKIELVFPGKNRNYSEKDASTAWEDWLQCKYQEVSF